MMGVRFAENPSYVQYEALLKRLHGLIARGLGDAAEADAIRDAMEAPERNLTRAEIVRLNGLSADLYMLDNAEVLASAHAIEMPTLFERVRDAQRNEDWEQVLSLLRSRGADVTDEAVAFSRSRAYQALGHYDTALLFLEHALRKSTSRDPNYEVIRMDLLEKAGRIEEAETRALEHLSSNNPPPIVAISAVDLLFRLDTADGRSLPTPSTAQFLSRALDAALKEVAVPTGRLKPFVVVAHLLRAGCLQALGRLSDALAACDDAIRLDPDGSELLALRQVLMNANGMDQAGVQRAIKHALTAAETRARRFVPVAA